MSDPLADRHHLSSWLRRGELEAESRRKIAKIMLETGGDLPNASTPGRAPGDERTLRGIPAIGRGVGGAIPRTRPDLNLDRIRVDTAWQQRLEPKDLPSSTLT